MAGGVIATSQGKGGAGADRTCLHGAQAVAGRKHAFTHGRGTEQAVQAEAVAVAVAVAVAGSHTTCV